MNKIFVSDFVKEVEIGAFQSERGCTQKIKFNVSLDVRPFSPQLNDNVDKILSYEVIMDAINFELSHQRFNLLETLAEKVADRCLEETRVTCAEVKIEKLDRIPGSLGVHISRNKMSRKKTENIVSEDASVGEISLVVFSSTLVGSDEMQLWLTALIESHSKLTVLVEPLVNSFQKPTNNFAMLQIALLAMEQDAWRSSCLDERLSVVCNKSELYWAAQRNKVSFFCPSNFTKDSISPVPNLLNNFEEFLVWFTKQLGIKNLYLVGWNQNKLKVNVGNLNVSFFSTNDWNRF